MEKALINDLPTFVYENNILIYQNKQAEELKLDTVLLENLLEGSRILGERYLETELISLNLNGINLHYKNLKDKNILIIGNDIEEIKRVYEKIIRSF